MALHLETGAGVLLHIVGDLLDLLHGLGLQRGLAGLEEDVVRDELAGLGDGLLDGGHGLFVPVIQFDSALGDHDIADKRQVRMIERNLERHPCRLLDLRQIDHPVPVKVNLQRALVERKRHMVPALLEFVFKAHFPGILGARVIIIIGMMVPRSAHAMDQAKSAAFAIITAPFGTVRVIGQTEFQVIQADVILIVPIIEIILDGEFFGQVGSLFLDQRRDDTVVGNLDGLDSAQGLDLGTTVQQVPLGRELAHHFSREIILEQNDFAALEIG